MPEQDAKQGRDVNSAERWEAYLQAYGPVAAAERLALLERSVADEVTFTNPGGEGRTRDGMIRHIEAFQAQMPGTTFATERLYQHHGELLAVWAMHGPDGARVAVGHNFVQLAQDGRFKHMAGFF